MTGQMDMPGMNMDMRQQGDAGSTEQPMSSHMIRGRQLSRDTEHRKAMRRNLVQSLFEHGKVRTTEPKAKEIKAFAEKLITLAKNDSVLNRRRVTQLLNDRRVTDEEQEFVKNERGRDLTVVQRLFKEVAPKLRHRFNEYEDKWWPKDTLKEIQTPAPLAAE